MRRFVARFLLGALFLVALYEVIQRLGFGEGESDEMRGDAWQLAEIVHEHLADEGQAGSTAHPPEELLKRLGVAIESITKDDYLRACSTASLVTNYHGVEICVGARVEEGPWPLVANLPAGPIELDGADLLEADDALALPHLLSFALLFAGMAALGAALAWSPARQLRHLAKATSALRDGDLSARATVPRGGLVAPVALAFNDMAAQVQKTVGWQELLLQTVAHELRTPLSRVRFIAERVSDAREDTEREEALGDLDLELTEMEALISSLLSLLKVEGGIALARVPSDVAELLDDLLEQLDRRQRYRDPRLAIWRVGFEDSSPLARVDRQAASRVFGNLLSNAAAHARTQVRVTVAREEHALMVAIEDDGDGVSDDQRSQILEPFVRLDDGRARAGTGLGLAIVRRLAEAHGHPVVLCASDLGGLRVETRWPLEGEAGED